MHGKAAPERPVVGVLIRTLDESELIGRCLDTLRAQRSDVELDVLVLDSGSTDATLEIARAHGARTYEMAPEEFDYSKALNVGIERLRGDLVICLSAHAIPLDADWVARMIAPFDDPRVAGVAGRQVPWASAPWREVHRLARTFGERPQTYTDADAEHGILFSNAASCIRRHVWETQRFTLPAAEDVEWARRVALAGWKIVYEARAAVYHSHDENPRAQARRLIDLHRIEAGPAAQRTRVQTLREVARFLYNDGSDILALDEPVRRKLAHLSDLAQMVRYYVTDFSCAGTTAELRRRNAT